MRSGAIIRAFCVDGPCQGLRYVDYDSGHVLFSDVADGDWCIYKISGETIDTIAGCRDGEEMPIQCLALSAVSLGKWRRLPEFALNYKNL